MSEAAVVIPPVSSALAVEATQESRRYGWAVTMAFVLCIRAIVFAVGVISVAPFLHPHIIAYNATGKPWIAFDSGFYRDICVNGYPHGPSIPYHIAYFPLYPLFSRFVATFVGTEPALLLVANLCSVIGLVYLYAWARSLTTARTAFIAVMLMACYPGAVFFSAALTEGPFMMLVAIALYLLRKERVYAAAVCSAFATALRPTSAALGFIIVLWAVTRSWDMPKGKLLVRFLLVGLIAGSGGMIYEGYLRHEYGKWNAYKLAEDKWELNQDTSSSTTNSGLLDLMSMKGDARTIAKEHAADQSEPKKVEPRRYSLAFFLDRVKTPQAWNRVFAWTLVIIMLAAVIQPTGIPRIFLGLPLVIFLMAYLPNGGLRASSIFRYESAGIPLFVITAIWLSSKNRKPLLFGLLGLSLLVQIYYAFLYSRGVWVG